jgi:hypothetical protein
LNGERRLQLYRYWPQTARLDTLPASTSFVWGKSFVRAFPDGKEAAFVGVSGPSADGFERLHAIDLTTGVTRKLRDEPTQFRGGESFAVSADNQSVLLPVALGDGFAVAAIPRNGSGNPPSCCPRRDASPASTAAPMDRSSSTRSSERVSGRSMTRRPE